MEENLKQQDTRILKFALFGPESTGKTTLAKQLASYYETEWVPEFARDYLQEKWEENQHICVEEDMMPIAYGQTKLENDKLALANKFLFCDTNLMVTKVFSEMYYDYCNPLLNEAALEHEYDLFFLTDIDVPWEKDDIRDSPKERESVFSVFKETLIETKKPYITLSGNKKLRLAKAVEIINNLVLVKELGFSKCRLSLAIPRGENYTDLKQFEGKSIATSYPNLTSQFLLKNGVKAEMHEISGSVEIAPSIGLAEGICDIVSTGGTLLSNGLKEVATVFQSQAVMIANATLSSEKQAILDKLLFRIDSVQRGQNAKYVVLNVQEQNIEKVTALLPGMKSPSVLPLATKGWFSLHSVIEENDFWNIIENLRDAGAEGILVLPIEKMIL